MARYIKNQGRKLWPFARTVFLSKSIENYPQLASFFVFSKNWVMCYIVAVSQSACTFNVLNNSCFFCSAKVSSYFLKRTVSFLRLLYNFINRFSQRVTIWESSMRFFKEQSSFVSAFITQVDGIWKSVQDRIAIVSKSQK